MPSSGHRPAKAGQPDVTRESTLLCRAQETHLETWLAENRMMEVRKPRYEPTKPSLGAGAWPRSPLISRQSLLYLIAVPFPPPRKEEGFLDKEFAPGQPAF